MLRLLQHKILPQVRTRTGIKYLTTTATRSPPPSLPNQTLIPKSKSSSTIFDPSLTLHFLQNSCGLSREAALSAAKKVQLKTSDNPLSVLTLFKAYGFSKADIARIIAGHPKLLVANPDRTLKPKLDFYCAIGLLGPDLPGTALLSNFPTLLLQSLKNKIIPNYNVLKSILQSDENVIATLKNMPYLVQAHLPSLLPPEIKALQDHGVPMPVISKLLKSHPGSLIRRAHCFEENLGFIKKLDIDPSRLVFAHAFGVLARCPKSEWERKLNNFKSLGWSEHQVLCAFARHPYCMAASTEKIRRNVEFFREKLNWDPACLSAMPVLLSLSLEKRIVPRCSVISILASKGLVEGQVRVRQLLLGEKRFLEKYVIKYQDKVPEVVDSIQGKRGVVGLKTKQEKLRGN